jgi:hypothetical protein
MTTNLSEPSERSAPLKRDIPTRAELMIWAAAASRPAGDRTADGAAKHSCRCRDHGELCSLPVPVKRAPGTGAAWSGGIPQVRLCAMPLQVRAVVAGATIRPHPSETALPGTDLPGNCKGLSARDLVASVMVSCAAIPDRGAAAR